MNRISKENANTRMDVWFIREKLTKKDGNL